MTRNPLSDGSPVTAVYFNALANALDGEGVIDGCDATPGTGNFEVDIASGNVALGRSKVSVGSTTVTHDSPDAEDRWDLITVNSSGTVSITKGTAASTSGQPNAPDIPADEVLLAPVYIRSGASEILAGDIENEFNAIVDTLMADVHKAGGAVYNAVYADEGSIPAEHEVEGAVVYLQDQEDLFVAVDTS